MRVDTHLHFWDRGRFTDDWFRASELAERPADPHSLLDAALAPDAAIAVELLAKGTPNMVITQEQRDEVGTMFRSWGSTAEGLTA